MPTSPIIRARGISSWCRLPASNDLRRRIVVTIAAFGAIAAAACLAAPLVGTTPIALSRVFDRSIPFADNVDAQVFFIARLPRVLAALLVGSRLAVAVALGAMGAGRAGLAARPRVLDLVSLGAAAAESRGVDVRRAERLALVSASVLTGSAVSLGGPIPFVGIIVPHIVRLIVGADHRLVLPASALFGGSFLIVCDVVARVAFGPAGMPVGAVTALLGGPFFLWLLFRRFR